MCVKNINKNTNMFVKDFTNQEIITVYCFSIYKEQKFTFK